MSTEQFREAIYDLSSTEIDITGKQLAFQFLTDVSLSPQNSHYLIQFGVIEALFPFLALESDVCSMYSCYILANLAVDENNQITIGQYPIYEKLTYILANSRNTNLLEKVLMLLTNLSCAEQNYDEIARNNVIEYIANVLEFSNEQISIRIILLIQNILHLQSTKHYFFEKQGIKVLYKMIIKFRQNEQIINSTSVILSILSFEEINKLISGGIFPILHLQLRSSIIETHQNSLRIITNISADEKNREELFTSGIVPMLIELLELSTDEEVLEHTIMTLSNLSLNEFISIRIVDIGGVPFILFILSESNNQEILMRTAKLISNLALYETARYLLFDSKEILQRKLSSSNHQNFIHFANLALKRLNMPITNQKMPPRPVLNPNQMRRNSLHSPNSLNRGAVPPNRGGQQRLSQVPQQQRPNSQNLQHPPLAMNQRGAPQQQQQRMGHHQGDPQQVNGGPQLQRGGPQPMRGGGGPQQRPQLRNSQLGSAPQRPPQSGAPSPSPSSPSPSSDPDDKLSKDRVRRVRIINEIVETEKTYVFQLLSIIQLYIKPIQAMNESGKPLISEISFREIFSTVELLFNMHAQFLQKLEKALLTKHPSTPPPNNNNNNNNEIQHLEDEIKIGDVFLGLVDCLRMYRNYISNYDKSIDALSTSLENPKFKLYLDTQQLSDPDGQPLSAMLITPIQRIPRYSLLLQDLIKHMQEDHPDFKNVNNALQGVLAVANYLNHERGKTEAVNKVINIQEQFTNLPIKLVEPHRTFIKEGDVISESKKSKNLQYHRFFLFTDLLLEGLQKGEKFRVKNLFYLQHTKVISMPTATSFRLITQEDGYTYSTDSGEERDVWLNVIGTAITDFKRNSMQRRVASIKVNKDLVQA